jgi:hypothetical protein
MVGGAVAHLATAPEPCCGYLEVMIADPTGRIMAQGPHPRLTSTQSGNILCARDQQKPSPLGPLAETARARGGKD